LKLPSREIAEKTAMPRSGNLDRAILTRLLSHPANVQFFGFVSNTPVNAPLYIHLATGNASIVMTDFAAYSVPEPHSMLLVGIGLVILSLARQKLRVALEKS